MMQSAGDHFLLLQYSLASMEPTCKKCKQIELNVKYFYKAWGNMSVTKRSRADEK
jgi:hypothetical protein